MKTQRSLALRDIYRLHIYFTKIMSDFHYSFQIMIEKNKFTTSII